MEKSKSILNSLSKKIIIYVSIIAVSLLLIIPVYLSCQSNAMEKKIEQSDKMLVIDWISGKLTEFYIDAETADQMTTHIKKQSKNDRYDEYTTVEQFIARLTKDLQGISKDMHLRLKINTNMPDSTTDGTEEAIPANIVGEKRKNFQFKEIKVLEGNVGYLRLDAFRNPKYAAPTAIAAMNFLANCDAVIFDLRYNGGGYAEMVQLILSYLFDEPVHYLNSYTRKDDRTDEWITHSEVSGPRMQDVLVYVLTGNKLTFSAAEEFAFALQNQKRATIVGEQTTGGGHGIDFFFLREYYIEFRIPTEKSADPKTGESWEISGIEPDVKCKSEQAFGLAYELALEALADQATGSRQNELTRLPAIVHGPADVIPDRWFHLPFIDKPGHHPLEYQGGINGDRHASIPVHVKENLTLGDLPGGGCLATGPGPFDDNSPCRREASGQFIICNTS